MKNKSKLLYISALFLSLLLLGKLLTGSSRYESTAISWKEEYDPALSAKIHSVADLLHYVNTTSAISDKQSLAYAEVLAHTVRKRFYHGYCYYGFSENWSAWLAGKLIWNHLNAIVLPDDILKHSTAACSQQAIVLMACFKQLNIPYRAVLFSHHYASEALFNGKWYYFDTDKEPVFANGRKSVDELLKTGEFYTAYSASSPEDPRSWLGNGRPVYSNINLTPAPKAAFFQQATNLFSTYAPWVIVLCVVLRLRIARKSIGRTSQIRGIRIRAKKAKLEV